MAPASATSSGEEKTVTFATVKVTIGAPVEMAPADAHLPEAVFMPQDFQAKQDAIGLKRRRGKPLVITEFEATERPAEVPADVPPTTVEPLD